DDDRDVEQEHQGAERDGDERPPGVRLDPDPVFGLSGLGPCGLIHARHRITRSCEILVKALASTCHPTAPNTIPPMAPEEIPDREDLGHLLWEVGARVGLMSEAALSRTPLTPRSA